VSCTLQLDPLAQRDQQAALADTRSAEHGDELRSALAKRLVPEPGEQGQLGVPADERRACGGTFGRLPLGDDLPDCDRLGLTLRLHGLGLAIVEDRLGRPVGGLADDDPVHLRPRLQPRGRVHHVAGGHSLTLGRSCSDHDERLAGVHGGPEVDVQPFIRRVQVRDRPSHRKRGAHGALGVVLVRGRRAEQRDHGVADELLHRAAEVLQFRADAGVVRREPRPDVLGVHLLRARG
jgi:hypothetical protein